MTRRQLTYRAVGATVVDGFPGVPGFRRYEATVRVGEGDACWERARAAVMRWEVKTRSGFRVESASESSGDAVVSSAVRPTVNSAFWLVFRAGPWTIREPVRVVAVVDEPDRAGYAYGTLTGHPIAGEEAFLVEHHDDGAVWFRLRSLTGPPAGVWRVAFPGVLVAQRIIRKRYLRALLTEPG